MEKMFLSLPEAAKLNNVHPDTFKTRNKPISENGRYAAHEVIPVYVSLRAWGLLNGDELEFSEKAYLFWRSACDIYKSIQLTITVPEQNIERVKTFVDPYFPGSYFFPSVIYSKNGEVVQDPSPGMVAVRKGSKDLKTFCTVIHSHDDYEHAARGGKIIAAIEIAIQEEVAKL